MLLRLNSRIKRIYAYALLFIFIGYYASITLFYHSHIVLGDTIVHSHPFKADNHGVPLHSHSEQGFITIHLLASFSIAFILSYFSFKTIAPVAYEIILKTRQEAVNHTIHYLYSLRAPPADMFR
jgi:hypothetical protein